MSARGIFVTGTDTGVGKTVASCALIAALRARGIRAHPFKPIAAGATRCGSTWANEDTVALAAAAGLGDDAHDLITPVLLREPLAPHIAAAREGRTLSLDPLRAAFQRISRDDAFVVAEGVGGLRVPLDRGLDNRGPSPRPRLPVVLVVGMRLGCLNHALLSKDAIAAAGLRLAGWIANTIDPQMTAL
jgi:dethiobiotin synthetase